MSMKVAVIGSVVLAVGTSVWAWAPWRWSGTTSGPAQQSALLTTSGKEASPDRVASLRVVKWDAQEKAPKAFEVAKKNNVWVIPSHFDYPADGGSRVGETAGGVLNLRRGPLVSAKKEQHGEFGVLDPLAETAGDDSARGTRVTLKDEGGAVLVDLIVGKPASTEGLRYVREAGKDEVYTAKANVDISTAFKDWVETDLLKITRPQISRLAVRDYTVDAARGRIDTRSSTVLQKPATGTTWTSADAPPGKKVTQATIDKLLTEATSLKLTGVRPFDPTWLQQRGFYVVRRPDGSQDVVGNEGALEIATDDGLRYRLFFGGLALGDEEDTSPTSATQPTTTKPSGSHNRYMVVLVEPDPEYIEAANASAASQPTTNPTTQATTKAASQPAVAEKPRPTTQQVADARKKADEKMQRFQSFFYVISDESFKKLRPAPTELFDDASVAKDKLPGEKVPAETQLSTRPGDLQFADLKVGDGPEAADGDTVEVHYTGWLAKDGKKFDSSHDHGQPLSFTIGKPGIIKGWSEGVPGMKVGGKRKLVIPAELAYGAEGKGPDIPPDAQLVFDIELVKVQKPTTQQ